jgi:hypothetical protein
MRVQQVSKIQIYLIGVLILGLTYHFIKDLLSGPVFLLSVLGYLVLIRFVAERYGRAPHR